MHSSTFEYLFFNPKFFGFFGFKVEQKIRKYFYEIIFRETDILVSTNW